MLAAGSAARRAAAARRARARPGGSPRRAAACGARRARDRRLALVARPAGGADRGRPSAPRPRDPRPRRRPGRRDPARAADGGPVLVDAGPPGGGAADRLDASSGSTGSRPSSSPTTSSTTPARIAEVLADAARRAAWSYAPGGAGVLPARRRAPACRVRVARGRRAPARGACGSTSSGRRDGLPRRTGRATRTRARWSSAPARHGFAMLLTGDAEAEAAPVDPGPVDVLKVAHHGSEDAGLGGPARPRLAAARGDLGRGGQRLRPSGRSDSRRAGGAGCRSCARIRTARWRSRSAMTAGPSGQRGPPIVAAGGADTRRRRWRPPT